MNEITYPCGCSACGPTPLPEYCPEHDRLSLRDPVKALERGYLLLDEWFDEQDDYGQS